MWKKFGRFFNIRIEWLELTATLERFEPGECCATAQLDLLFHLRGRAPFRC
jgi:hypothetical protein